GTPAWPDEYRASSWRVPVPEDVQKRLIAQITAELAAEALPGVGGHSGAQVGVHQTAESVVDRLFRLRITGGADGAEQSFLVPVPPRGAEVRLIVADGKGDKQAAGAVLHQFRKGIELRADNGETEGDRFQEHHAERIPVGGKHEHIGDI